MVIVAMGVMNMVMDMARKIGEYLCFGLWDGKAKRT